MSVLLAVPSLLFSTTIDQPQVHLIKDQLNLIKFDGNDNDDNFDNDSHDEVINSEPIQKSFEVEKLIRAVQPAWWYGRMGTQLSLWWTTFTRL